MKIPSWKMIVAYLGILVGFAASLVYVIILLNQGRIQNITNTNIESAYYVSQFVYAVVGVMVTTISAFLLISNLQVITEESGRSQRSIDDNQFNNMVDSFDRLSDYHKLHINYMIRHINSAANEISKLSMQTRSIASNSVYLKAFFDNEESGSVIRNIHRIFKFIDAIPDEQRQDDYAKLLRSRLNQNLLTVLHYNSKCTMGEKQMPFIQRFEITKHLNRLNLMELHHIRKFADLTQSEIGALNLFAERIWDDFVVRVVNPQDYKYRTIFKGAYGVLSYRKDNEIRIRLTCQKNIATTIHYGMGSGFERFSFDDQINFVISVFVFELHRFASASQLVTMAPKLDKSQKPTSNIANITIKCRLNSIDKRLKYDY